MAADDVRDELAPLFPHDNPSNGLVGSCKPGNCWCGADRRMAVLLPIVARLVAEAKAEALREAAEELDGPAGLYLADLLRARAEAAERGVR